MVNPLNINIFPSKEEEVREAYGTTWRYSAYYRCWKSIALTGPQVRCKCGEGAFYITYGDYECIATCLFCGDYTTVYEG